MPGRSEELPPQSSPGATGPWQDVRDLLGIGSPADWAFRFVCQACALVIVLLVLLLVALLTIQAWPAITHLGLSLIDSVTWDPNYNPQPEVADSTPAGQYGGLAFVYGSVVTSLLAMLLAVPLGVGTAAFLAEIAPGRVRRIGSFLVELLAAIPSVVYGFWGIHFLAPLVQDFAGSKIHGLIFRGTGGFCRKQFYGKIGRIPSTRFPGLSVALASSRTNSNRPSSPCAGGRAAFLPPGMSLRWLAPLGPHEVVERLRRRLPMSCTGCTDDVVEVGRGLERQFPGIFEAEQPPFARSEKFFVTGGDCREQGIDVLGHSFVRTHLRRA